MTEEQVFRQIPGEDIVTSTTFVLGAIAENMSARIKGNTKETKASICKLAYGLMKIIKNSNIQFYEGLEKYAVEGYKNETTKEGDF